MCRQSILKIFFVKIEIVARVVELVDTPDLGSGAERCGGSSPPSRTTQAVVIVEFAETEVHTLK